MHILITGGAGFLGRQLARALLDLNAFALAGMATQTIATVTLTDIAAPDASLMNDRRVRFVAGDLAQALATDTAMVTQADLIVHLSAAVSGECEADLDLGLRSNLEATQLLLQAARKGGRTPMFVYASSVAVFGAMPGLPMPAVIDDHTLPAPQSSYGIQKFIGEQLVADFSRRGLIDGRNVRLMTVAIRPGKPNGAASGFLSGMVREPLAGIRAAVPVDPLTRVALASPTSTIAGLLRTVQTTQQAWGPRTALNFPALSTTVGDIVQALERLAGSQTSALLDWVPDARIAAIVGGWPHQFDATRAQTLGLLGDASIDALIQEYIDTQSRA